MHSEPAHCVSKNGHAPDTYKNTEKTPMSSDVTAYPGYTAHTIEGVRHWVKEGHAMTDTEHVYKEKFDPKKNKPYFINLKAKASVWSLPVAAEASAEASPKEKKAKKSKKEGAEEGDSSPSSPSDKKVKKEKKDKKSDKGSEAGDLVDDASSTTSSKKIKKEKKDKEGAADVGDDSSSTTPSKKMKKVKKDKKEGSPSPSSPLSSSSPSAVLLGSVSKSKKKSPSTSSSRALLEAALSKEGLAPSPLAATTTTATANKSDAKRTGGGGDDDIAALLAAVKAPPSSALLDDVDELFGGGGGGVAKTAPKGGKSTTSSLGNNTNADDGLDDILSQLTSFERRKQKDTPAPTHHNSSSPAEVIQQTVMNDIEERRAAAAASLRRNISPQAPTRAPSLASAGDASPLATAPQLEDKKKKINEDGDRGGDGSSARAESLVSSALNAVPMVPLPSLPSHETEIPPTKPFSSTSAPLPSVTPTQQPQSLVAPLTFAPKTASSASSMPSSINPFKINTPPPQSPNILSAPYVIAGPPVVEVAKDEPRKGGGDDGGGGSFGGGAASVKSAAQRSGDGGEFGGGGGGKRFNPFGGVPSTPPATADAAQNSATQPLVVEDLKATVTSAAPADAAHPYSAVTALSSADKPPSKNSQAFAALWDAIATTPKEDGTNGHENIAAPPISHSGVPATKNPSRAASVTESSSWPGESFSTSSPPASSHTLAGGRGGGGVGGGKQRPAAAVSSPASSSSSSSSSSSDDDNDVAMASKPRMGGVLQQAASAVATYNNNATADDVSNTNPTTRGTAPTFPSLLMSASALANANGSFSSRPTTPRPATPRSARVVTFVEGDTIEPHKKEERAYLSHKEERELRSSVLEPLEESSSFSSAAAVTANVSNDPMNTATNIGKVTQPSRFFGHDDANDNADDDHAVGDDEGEETNTSGGRGGGGFDLSEIISKVSGGAGGGGRSFGGGGGGISGKRASLMMTDSSGIFRGDFDDDDFGVYSPSAIATAKARKTAHFSDDVAVTAAPPQNPYARKRGQSAKNDFVYVEKRERVEDGGVGGGGGGFDHHTFDGFIGESEQKGKGRGAAATAEGDADDASSGSPISARIKAIARAVEQTVNASAAATASSSSEPPLPSHHGDKGGLKADYGWTDNLQEARRLDSLLFGGKASEHAASEEDGSRSPSIPPPPPPLSERSPTISPSSRLISMSPTAANGSSDTRRMPALFANSSSPTVASASPLRPEAFVDYGEHFKDFARAYYDDGEAIGGGGGGSGASAGPVKHPAVARREAEDMLLKYGPLFREEGSGNADDEDLIEALNAQHQATTAKMPDWMRYLTPEERSLYKQLQGRLVAVCERKQLARGQAKLWDAAHGCEGLIDFGVGKGVGKAVASAVLSGLSAAALPKQSTTANEENIPPPTNSYPKTISTEGAQQLLAMKEAILVRKRARRATKQVLYESFLAILEDGCPARSVGELMRGGVALAGGGTAEERLDRYAKIRERDVADVLWKKA